MNGKTTTYSSSVYRFYVQWQTDYYYALASATAAQSGGSVNWTAMLGAKFTFTGDRTLSDYIVATAKEQYMSALYISETFRDLGLTMTDEDWKEVDKIIQTDWVQQYGNDGFVSLCNKLDMTYDDFRELMASNLKSQKIVEYYYGKGGVQEVTDAEKKEYFLNNYVRFKYVIMLTVDSDGNELGTEEKAAVEAKRDAILAALDSGSATFEDLVLRYSEDYIEITDEMTESEKTAAKRQNDTIIEDGLVTDADGVFDQTLATYYNISLDEKLIEKVYALKEGEYAAVETDEAIWIVKKYSNAEKESYFENVESSVYQALYADDLSAKHTNWRTKLNYVYNEACVAEYLPEKLSNLFQFDTGSSSTTTTTTTTTSTSSSTTNS